MFHYILLSNCVLEVQSIIFSVTVFSFFSYMNAFKMILLCKVLQRTTAHHQAEGAVTTVTELLTALSGSVERKFHRMEYNTVLSESGPEVQKAGL